MTELPIGIVNVVTAEGDRYYVALTSSETAFSAGLIGEAILGVLKQLPVAGEPITPDNFTPNAVFSRFLADVIARNGPADPDLQAEATRIRDGHIVVVDQRTRTPEGPVPPHDTVGVFRVEDGKVVPGSYMASPNHRLLTADGFLQLNRNLSACLQRELEARTRGPD